MDKSLITEYENKDQDYFNCPRPEMLAYIPEDCKYILDVGCGGGFFGASLRNRKADSVVWGVEPDQSCIELAKNNLDKIYHGCFDSELGLPEGFFDCIIFNDVLEHVIDPIPVLEYAKKLLKKKWYNSRLNT